MHPANNAEPPVPALMRRYWYLHVMRSLTTWKAW